MAYHFANKAWEDYLNSEKNVNSKVKRFLLSTVKVIMEIHKPMQKIYRLLRACLKIHFM